MSGNRRWPDFHFASTLKSLVSSNARVEAPGALQDHRDAPITDFKRDPETALDPYGYGNHDDDSHKAADDSTAQMAHSPGEPDGLSEFEGFDDSVGGADADFGTLEMFDSNSSQAPYSSQLPSVSQLAPQALMGEMPLSSQSKKSKRDKKSKKKRTSIDTANASSLSDVLHARDIKADASANGDPAAMTSSQSKKKRKLSDTSNEKRRKKRKSPEEDATEGAPAGEFLLKGRGKRNVPEDAIYEEDVDADVRDSPSAARLRRRSLSREALSRENSAPPAPAADPMNIDDDGGDQALALEPPPVTQEDVANMAREAWNEHLSAEAQPAIAADERDAPAEDADATQVQASVYEDPVNPSREPESTPRRTRSTRKKAKPTFYEQPLELDEDENVDAFDELPSPSAMTPKPRKRALRASKGRKPQRPKLSQSMRGGSEEPEGSSQVRQGKMAGYTQGRFSDDELTRLAKAVDNYRKMYDMTQQEVNAMIQAPGGTTAGDEHAQLWSMIFAECPDRHRQKVINVCRKKFHNFVARGTWTAEQDAELTEAINSHGTKWSVIAGIINRHPEDVRDRYRNYIVCGDAQRKDAWSEEEEQRLTKEVVEAMGVIDEMRTANIKNEALQTKSYEELIDWQNISERMDRTRSRLQCITKWKWLNIRLQGKDKLVSTEPDSKVSFRLEAARRQIKDMPDEERFRLLLAIKNTNVSIDAKIPWQKLVDKAFRDTWHRTTQILLWRRLKQTVPDWEMKSVRDCLQHLVEQYNQTGELPDVTTGDYDNAAESALVKSLKVPTKANGTPGGKSVSAEFVVNSDAEDGAAAAQNGETAPVVSDVALGDDLQIDPALTEEAPLEQNEPTPKKTPAKRASGKRKSKAAAPTPTQDTIVDDELPALKNDGPNDDGSDIDVEQFRKKKTPSKYKAASERKTKAPAPAEGASDSGMDDMQDLPAKIAA